MTRNQVAPWLADSRWPTVPIRFLARLGTGHTPSRSVAGYWENCSIPWLTLADVWQLRRGSTDVITDTKEKISEIGLANSAAVKHSAGTVILSRTASVGFSAILGSDMATSQDFATWTCGPTLYPRYLLHALRAMAGDLKRVAAGSTHKTIYMPDIEQLRIPAPPLDEQRRIASFLDAETARIEALGAKRKKQRDLLDEHYLTAIFSAIAGLNEPGGRRRCSTASWLGSVPDDWPIMPVGYQFEVLLGKMLNQERVHGDYLRPYLRNTNVQWDKIDTDDLSKMDFRPNEQSRYRVLSGDLLVCEGGEPGRSAIWDGRFEEIYYQKALHRVRPRGYSSPRWLYYCLRAATAQNVFAIEGNTTTIAHLTSEQLKAHRLPFPARDAQDRAVERLDAMSSQQDVLATQLRKQQSMLAERRQALTAAAVTGQIDVSATGGRGIED